MATPRADNYTAATLPLRAGFVVSQGSFPAWRSAAVNTWAAISNTAVPQELKDYCGVGMRSESSAVELFSGATGGHGGNLANNRVMTIDLLADAPVWVQRLAGSDATGWPTTGTLSAYFPSDDRPAPRHTYGGCFWSPERSAYIVQGRFFGSQAVDHRVTDAWAPGVNWTKLGDRTPSATTDAYNPATGTYYTTIGERWVASTNTWSSWPLSGSASVGRLGNAFDTLRGTIFHLSSYDGWSDNGVGINCCRITTGGAKTAIAFNASAAWTQFQSESSTQFLGATLVYNPDLDVFYFYAGKGQTVYVITPNAGTTWDMSILPVSGVTPPSCLVFGKLKYSSRLKCLLLTPANDTAGFNVHYLRTE
jgi:hypothetical protein